MIFLIFSGCISDEERKFYGKWDAGDMIIEFKEGIFGSIVLTEEDEGTMYLEGNTLNFHFSKTSAQYEKHYYCKYDYEFVDDDTLKVHQYSVSVDKDRPWRNDFNDEPSIYPQIWHRVNE